MKILFSPEYTGHVFLGLNEQNPEVMDTMVCDTMGLVAALELRLGIYVEDLPGHNRTVMYYKAMSEYMRQQPDNALAASFKLSSLGVASQALRWRDNLVLDHWEAKAQAKSGRLEVLAGTEAHFDCLGMADRLLAVLYNIKKVEENRFSDLEIELPCTLSLLHPTVIELLTALKEHGSTITERVGKAEMNNNLGRVAKMLQSGSAEKLTLDENDDSLQIYKFTNANAAQEYLALKGEEIGADVWVNGSNKSMDNWLRLMGKPTMGSSMSEASPQIVQLFVLGLGLMSEPLNIQTLISWLYAPMLPFGTFFGGILADAIIGKGGYRNEECKKVVANYIDGKYTYHDEEEDKKLTEKEIAKRNEQEKKERQLLVDTYLPSFEVQQKVETTKLHSYLNSLGGWAKSRAHFLREKPENEGWISQLESLGQMCETFVLLLDASNMGKYADMKLVETWISTLYKGESFMQYAPQRGSRELIDSPAKMAADSQRTVWMGFAGNDSQQLDCGFLYPSEREKVKDDLKLWDEQKENEYRQQMGMMPFLMTDKQLILVTTDYTDGEPTEKHPIMLRLDNQIENLDKFIKTPNLLEEDMEDVKLVSNANTQAQIAFEHSDLLHWPGHLSPTTLGTLVEYPFDFMMERMLNIVSTGPGSIAELRITKGNVAHAVIESLFAPRDGKQYSTAVEITHRIDEEFSEQVRRNIEACGAILYLPENRLEAELLTEQLRRCLDALLEIIRDNHLVVTGCEQKVTKNMGLLQTEKDWDMIGFIDMTLEDEHHHPIVFDFKWTSSKTWYRNLLTKNRSTQLELYRDLLSAAKRDAVEKTAYFLMPEGHLYSKERFVGRYCTQVQAENNDNIVEQLKRSFLYRRKQMDSGIIEIGENFPSNMIDYCKDQEAEGLFPLTLEDGEKAKNIFSNYGLFK